MKTNIKIVIGANFGDEGKGLMTDYFAKEAKEAGNSCLVVCHNGGAQRGHTVMTPEKQRHIFHHFGAGTLEQADTYFSKDFILNPIIFRKEWEILKETGITPHCYAAKNCFVTIPYDMLFNQIIEKNRGEQKHGSCGMGIYETIFRNQQGFPLYLSELYEKSEAFLKEKICSIRENYIWNRLREEKVENLKKEEKEVLESDILIENFLEDCFFMADKMTAAQDEILKEYKTIIFEGAQGLLLDQNNKAYAPHLTPSNTGIKNPADMIKKVWKREEILEGIAIEACYVTRTYLTRHGAGRFDTECRKEEINPDMIDKTNLPNPYQDTLRYGKIDIDELRTRIQMDYHEIELPLSVSIAFTHMNETDGKIAGKLQREEICKEQWEEILYYSDGETRSSVKKQEKTKKKTYKNENR